MYAHQSEKATDTRTDTALLPSNIYGEADVVNLTCPRFCAIGRLKPRTIFKKGNTLEWPESAEVTPIPSGSFVKRYARLASKYPTPPEREATGEAGPCVGLVRQK